MRIFLSIIACIFLAGCTSASSVPESTLLTASGSATGAIAGYEIADKSLPGAAIGAAGGGIITQLFSDSNKQRLQAAYDSGYVQSRSDAIKRHYWLKQYNERPSLDGSRMAYYSVPASTKTQDGRELVEHNLVIPILE